MGQTAIPWIMAVAAAGAAVGSAVAAGFSAWFSFRSSRTATDVAVTNLVLKFREQYASDTMLDDLRNLRAWKDKHGPQFAETWAVMLSRGDEEARVVDRARRHVSSFFGAIIDLHDTGLVPKRIKKLLTDFEGFDVLVLLSHWSTLSARLTTKGALIDFVNSDRKNGSDSTSQSNP